MYRRSNRFLGETAGMLTGLILLCPAPLFAADLSQPGGVDQEQRNQTNRRQALEGRLSPEVDDVRLLPAESDQDNPIKR